MVIWMLVEASCPTSCTKSTPYLHCTYIYFTMAKLTVRIMKQIGTILLTILLPLIGLCAGNELQTETNYKNKPLYESQVIFDALNDGLGYHNYRIPSLLVTSKGTILAIMEGREDMNHDHAKNDLVLRRSEDNGKNWSSPSVIAESGDNVVMNPVIVQAEDGTIILTYIYFPEKLHSRDRSHGVKQVETGLKGDKIERVFVIKSKDEGKTWSKPKEITKVAKSSANTIVSVSGPGVGITLQEGPYKGRVIIPMSEAFLEDGVRKEFNFALYSDNNGKSWKHGEYCRPTPEGDHGGNEIQMVELNGGRVLASVRSKGCRLLSESNDGGNTWSNLRKQKELVDTGCMSPMIRYKTNEPSAQDVLIHIGVTGRVDGRKRGDALISYSKDEGKSWINQRELYSNAFDYSSLAVLKDGTIGMLAEFDFNGDRATIKFVRFNWEWVMQTNAISLKMQVVRPSVYFKTHPSHVIPEDMVIQRFKVALEAEVLGENSNYSYRFDLVEKQGDAKLLINDNDGKYSASNKNEFLADWYGPNVIEISVKDKAGNIVATSRDTIFVHFAHSKLAGGDVNNLDKRFKGKEYVTGRIENDKLVYPGMRFLPGDISRGDVRYEGTRFGAYETKEPRVLALKNGVLVASYHFQVKGKNDAPPGLTLVLTRSLDGGKTWIDDQILMQDVNGVVAYTSMVEWNDEIHCYFSGGHRTHQHADKYKGVYRTISKDQGKTWSNPEPMDEMTKLVSTKLDTISPCQSPVTNALVIPNMDWKGKKGDAYLVPFYVDPVKFLITMDGGKSWDLFYDVNEYPAYLGELNEISWALLDDRTIYVVSRRQSKTGYKNEMIFDLSGKPTFLGQSRRNHKARRCHQGAVKIPEGSYAGRVVVASNFSGDREEATIAFSETGNAEKFNTKYLTTDAAWGYCHIDWNPKLKGLVVIGESEPFDNNEEVVNLDGGPDRNERFNIECFAFSPEFYETLVDANIH
ncbi:exo-alpha-sialidase [Puteibacter caeruleilacunae]|nr:exo-alpha-sialidase [Puteibacter caeruleilacunae]